MRITTEYMQHSYHTSQVCILNYEDTISMWCFASPQWAGPDAFSVHPTKSTFITWGKEGGNGRVKHRDLTLDCWAVSKVNIIRCDLRIFVELVEEKTVSKCG